MPRNRTYARSFFKLVGQTTPTIEESRTAALATDCGRFHKDQGNITLVKDSVGRSGKLVLSAPACAREDRVTGREEFKPVDILDGKSERIRTGLPRNLPRFHTNLQNGQAILISS